MDPVPRRAPGLVDSRRALIHIRPGHHRLRDLPDPLTSVLSRGTATAGPLETEPGADEQHLCRIARQWSVEWPAGNYPADIGPCIGLLRDHAPVGQSEGRPIATVVKTLTPVQIALLIARRSPGIPDCSLTRRLDLSVFDCTDESAPLA
jgi:hypothetical protein